MVPTDQPSFRSVLAVLPGVLQQRVFLLDNAIVIRHYLFKRRVERRDPDIKKPRERPLTANDLQLVCIKNNGMELAPDIAEPFLFFRLQTAFSLFPWTTTVARGTIEAIRARCANKSRIFPKINRLLHFGRSNERVDARTPIASSQLVFPCPFSQQECSALDDRLYSP